MPKPTTKPTPEPADPVLTPEQIQTELSRLGLAALAAEAKVGRLRDQLTRAEVDAKIAWLVLDQAKVEAARLAPPPSA